MTLLIIASLIAAIGFFGVYRLISNNEADGYEPEGPSYLGHRGDPL